MKRTWEDHFREMMVLSALSGNVGVSFAGVQSALAYTKIATEKHPASPELKEIIGELHACIAMVQGTLNHITEVMASTSAAISDAAGRDETE